MKKIIVHLFLASVFFSSLNWGLSGSMEKVKPDSYFRESFDYREIDFRLAFISQNALETLVKNGQILIDARGLVRPEPQTGVFAIKPERSVKETFALIIHSLDYKNRAYPSALLIQAHQCLRGSPQSFLTTEWDAKLITAGDVIVITGD